MKLKEAQPECPWFLKYESDLCVYYNKEYKRCMINSAPCIALRKVELL